MGTQHTSVLGYLHRFISDCPGNWWLETTIILLIPIILWISDSGRVWLGNSAPFGVIHGYTVVFSW